MHTLSVNKLVRRDACCAVQMSSRTKYLVKCMDADVAPRANIIVRKTQTTKVTTAARRECRYKKTKTFRCVTPSAATTAYAWFCLVSLSVILRLDAGHERLRQLVVPTCVSCKRQPFLSALLVSHQGKASRGTVAAGQAPATLSSALPSSTATVKGDAVVPQLWSTCRVRVGAVSGQSCAPGHGRRDGIHPWRVLGGIASHEGA